LAFIKNLREARVRAALSQTELARVLNRPQSYVAKVESGDRRLDVGEAMHWAAAIGSSLSALLPHLKTEELVVDGTQELKRQKHE
jgi:transcriptional regulator with XRE-family HTH domain